MSPSVIVRIIRTDLTRYFATSLIALLVDIAMLSACLRLLDLSLAWSASIGFVAGGIVAYLLSIFWVFTTRTFSNAPALEFLAFIAIGLAGLGLTQLVLWFGVTRLGLLPELVKLSAAGATFAFNYLARKSLLFAARPRSAPALEKIA